MHKHTRREFLPLFGSLTAISSAQTFRYDLIVKGGRVIDPSQSLSAPRDVAIAGNKIARVDANIPAAECRLIVDARGKIVTPGLVDIHVHVYDGVAPLGIPADPNCIAKGATTVLITSRRNPGKVCAPADPASTTVVAPYLGGRPVHALG